MRLLSKEIGVEVVERLIDRSEVYLADEVFFCGTGVQIAAVTRVDHRPIGKGRMGPVTSQLRDLYFDVVRGQVDRYEHWCTPVYSEQKVSSGV
jgi:branched-chain amino acid aminotransferase